MIEKILLLGLNGTLHNGSLNSFVGKIGQHFITGISKIIRQLLASSIS
jgi:hypothetical protein